jgi:hypothetical protein
MSKIKTCELARQTISDYDRQDDCDRFLLSMALDGAIEIKNDTFEDTVIEESARHISKCIECQDWLDILYPDRQILRKRVAKYCCIEMFNAIDEADADVRFSYAFYYDEGSWQINEKFTFARFCPWCGKPLPTGSYE